MVDIDAETVGMVAPAFAPLAQHLLESRMERKLLEEEKDARMDLIEARAKNTPDLEPIESGSTEGDDEDMGESGSLDNDVPLDGAAEVAEEYQRRFEEAYENEECGFCKKVLEHLRELPLEKQVTGLKELAQLEEYTAAHNNPDPDVMRSMFDDFEVLNDENNFMSME